MPAEPRRSSDKPFTTADGIIDIAFAPTLAHDDLITADPTGRLPLVLLHGAVQTRRIWDLQVEELASERRVIVPDLRGHGETPLGTKRLTLPAMAEDVAALLTRLGTGPAVICGVSLGGMVALELAARHPEKVAALVLANTPRSLSGNKVLRGTVDALDPHRLLPVAFRWLGRERTAVAGLAIAGKILGPHWVGSVARAHFIRGFIAMEEKAIVATYRAIEECEPVDVATIRCPILLVDGDDDAGSIRAQMRSIVEEAPNARIEVLDAGHVAPLDDPEGFDRLLRAFLHRIEGSRG